MFLIYTQKELILTVKVKKANKCSKNPTPPTNNSTKENPILQHA